MSKPKKNLEKARQIKGLGNSGLKNFFQNTLVVCPFSVRISERVAFIVLAILISSSTISILVIACPREKINCGKNARSQKNDIIQL